MDKGATLGFIFGSLAFLWAMCNNHGHIEPENLKKMFWDFEAVVIVLFGTTAALFMSFRGDQVGSFMKVTSKVFINTPPDMKATFEKIMEFGVLARRDGVLALEEKIADIKDPFMAKGFRMLVDGAASEAVEHSLSEEIETFEKRQEGNHKMWERVGYFGPSLGMVGTLIGLVKMLANLNDPSKIGGGMAVALLTTFYGALMANFIAIPFECKLQQRTLEEVNYREMVKAGVMAILAGESPRQLNEKMLLFIKPADRAALEMK
ncbi:MAG: hypothetical protein RL095_699 [Verrucomicrobiota bacterium]